MDNSERFMDAWGHLNQAQRLSITSKLVLLEGGITTADKVAGMSKFTRAVWFIAVIAYAAFFLWISDQLPQVAFAAGVFLGAVLIAVWLLSLFRHK